MPGRSSTSSNSATTKVRKTLTKIYSSSLSSSNNENDAGLLNETVSIFSSPECSRQLPRYFKNNKSRTLSSSSSEEINLSKDIFELTPEKAEVVLSISRESSRSPLKSVNSTPSSKGSPAPKQLRIDKFVVQSHANTSVVSKKRAQQSKIDLFVKWKDPSRKHAAEQAKDKFFKKVDVPGVHDSFWTVPQHIVDKIDKVASPLKKKATPIKKKPWKKPTPIKAPSPIKKKTPVKKLKAKPAKTKKAGSSSEESDDPDLEEQMRLRREMMKNIMGKKKKENGAILQKVEEKNRARLADGQVIRKQEDRQRMHATDCPCCKEYYDALDLSPNSRQKRIQQASRHRFVHNPMPKTPEHYWDLGFPTSSEKRRRRAGNTANNSAAKKKLF